LTAVPSSNLESFCLKGVSLILVVIRIASFSVGEDAIEKERVVPLDLLLFPNQLQKIVLVCNLDNCGRRYPAS
jgi:hypothetical protein